MSLRRAPNPTLRGTLVLVLFGVLVVGAAWWYDGRDRVDVGPVETITEVRGQDYYSSVTFEVPDGSVSVDLEVGERTMVPTDEEGHEIEAEGDELRAPRGGSLVEVSWSGHQDTAQPNEVIPDHPEPRIVLHASGETYGLSDSVDMPARTSYSDPNEDEEQSTIIALPTSDPTFVVELEFAGKKQSVDMETGRRTLGAFAPLYRPQSRTDLGVPKDGEGVQHDGMTAYTSWRPVATRAPYLDGLGWAEPGREWVTLTNGDLSVNSMAASAKSPTEGRELHSYELDLDREGKGTVAVAGGRVVREPNSTVRSGDRTSAVYLPGAPVYDVPRGSVLKFTATVQIPVRPSEYDKKAPHRDKPFEVTLTASAGPEREPGADR